MSKRHYPKQSRQKRRQRFFRAVKFLAAVLRWLVSFALMAIKLWEKLTK